MERHRDLKHGPGVPTAAGDTEPAIQGATVASSSSSYSSFMKISYADSEVVVAAMPSASLTSTATVATDTDTAAVTSMGGQNNEILLGVPFFDDVDVTEGVAADARDVSGADLMDI